MPLSYAAYNRIEHAVNVVAGGTAAAILATIVGFNVADAVGLIGSEAEAKQKLEWLSGPCYTPDYWQSNKDLGRYNQKCTVARQSGKIAFVNYGDLSPGEATIITKQIEINLQGESEGRLTPTVTAVRATAAAEAELKATSPTCIDMKQDDHWASYIATKHDLDNLSQYDYVIAATDKVDCGGEVAGIADGKGNFFADVLAPIPEGEPKKARLARNKFIAATAGHEIGHLYKLGHSGELLNEDGSHILNDIEVPDDRLDLLPLIEAGTLEEYGNNCHIMGGSCDQDKPTKNLVFDPLQLYELSNPGQILANKTNLKLADKEPVSLSADESLGNFATISLSQPVNVKSVKHIPGYIVTSYTLFNQLAIRPLATGGNTTESSDAVQKQTVIELYLTNSQGRLQTARLGTIVLPGSHDQDTTKVIHIGEQSFSLTTSDTTITVQSV